MEVEEGETATGRSGCSVTTDCVGGVGAPGVRTGGPPSHTIALICTVTWTPNYLAGKGEEEGEEEEQEEQFLNLS